MRDRDVEPTARPRSSSPSTITHGAPRTSPAATTAARSGRRRTTTGPKAKSIAVGPTPPATSCPPASGCSTPGCRASARCTCRRTRQSCSATPSRRRPPFPKLAGEGHHQAGRGGCSPPVAGRGHRAGPAHARRPGVRSAARAARARARARVNRAPRDRAAATPGDGRRVHDRRRRLPEDDEAVEDLFEIVHRPQVQLDEEAVLARDAVAVDHLRHLTSKLRDLLQLARRRPDPDNGCDREADRLRIDLRAVARDHARTLEPLNPLRHRRRRD